MYILLKWVAFTLIIMFTAWLVPNFEVKGIPAAFLSAAVISLVNISLKPILTIITLPINIFTLGLFTLVINAFLLMFVAYLVPGLEVDGFLAAFSGAVIMSVLSIGLSFF